jgi:DNA-binding PadR family transcriptional regulator
LINEQIYAYYHRVRRKPGTLLPLEISILETAIELRRQGEDEFHGFSVAKEIAEREEARTLWGVGWVLWALGRMERAGLLESRWEDPAIAAAEGRPRRRLYHVTGQGAQALPVAAPDAIRRSPAVRQQGGLAPS